LDADASLSEQIIRSENSKKVEMQKIRADVHKEVDDLWSEVVNRFNTSDSKMDSLSVTTNLVASGMDEIMTFITATKAATTSTPAPTAVLPHPTPAQQQIQQQQTQHVPYVPAPSL
jgi:hypothetical protein